MAEHNDPEVRHEYVLLFDVRDGNPNGDPDAANQPRIDPETSHGLVTDVCIKRKIRNFVDVSAGTAERTKIFVQGGVALETQLKRAYTTLGLEGKAKKGGVGDAESVRQAKAWMCENFFDVRMFGAVMAIGKFQAGTVQGPAQFSFGRSIDPVVPTDHAITRVAATGEDEDKSTEMGSKWSIPYGLYRMHGYFSAAHAQRTGVTADDLDLLYRAMRGMFDLDRSAARGEMALRGLYVFSHDSELGDAPAHIVLESVQVQRKTGVAAPRAFTDYEIDLADPPAGVARMSLVG